MTSAVVDSGGGSVLELSSSGVENQEEGEKVSDYPAVIVEPVPSARLEQGYAAQVLVYDDETYMMQDVAEEQEVETENVETGALCSTTSLFQLKAVLPPAVFVVELRDWKPPCSSELQSNGNNNARKPQVTW
ncbi:ETS-related transcription factor Elf-2 [Myotis davidii]|uniref:ETS-related transcription factor Elf-2 n=1 Tax=Myotis davidii TaxID=225400 RepID=L5LR64_MYODS|nr:ETS-related transcription factor Elf-2 [Myotis davidii]